MTMTVSILLTSCGAKPAIIQMKDTDEQLSPTPAVGNVEKTQDNVGNALGHFAEVPTEESTPSKIFVHVCGAVTKPGVYEMVEGNRIFEAIELAAGFTEEAQPQAVNLADKVIDGQQVFVPTVEEAVMMPPVGNTLGRLDNQAGIQAEQSLININTADITKLQELNGIGEAKAQAILSYREKDGSFNSIEDIKNVSGIGEKLYEKIKDNITVD